MQTNTTPIEQAEALALAAQRSPDIEEARPLLDVLLSLLHKIKEK